MTMIEKIKELIEIMQVNDVRSVDIFYGSDIDVRVKGITVLKNFNDAKISPSENAEGIFHVEAIVDGIAFRGAVNDEELAEYQRAKAKGVA